MNDNEKIEASVTRIFKAVFPESTNHYDTLFGGTAIHLMDEVAFITATRFSRKKWSLYLQIELILPNPYQQALS